LLPLGGRGGVQARAGLLPAVLAELTEPSEQDGFALHVLLLADTAFLERELELEKLLAHRLVVGELLLGVLHDLVEAVADSRRRSGHRQQEELEQDHGARPPPIARAEGGSSRSCTAAMVPCTGRRAFPRAVCRSRAPSRRRAGPGRVRRGRPRS